MSRDKAIQHIGLFGGSFDPVHRGHLLAAKSVQQQLSLDEIIFLPAAQSPFKPRPKTSDKDRLAMLSLAIDIYPEFRLDERELLRSGPSYTIDTLRELVSEQPGNHYYLVMGMDAWAEFENWHAWQEILGLCHLCVMTRPTYKAAVTGNAWRERWVDTVQQIRQFKAGKLLFITVPASIAASRKIREQIENGRDPGQQLVADVRDYIEREGLYRSENEK